LSRSARLKIKENPSATTLVLQYHSLSLEKVKRIVRMEQKYKCLKCGEELTKSNKQNKIPTHKRGHIHHINWDENDNRRENLVLLCPSCHGEVHAFIPKEVATQLFDLWMEKNK